MVTQRVLYATLFFVLLMLLILVAKPSVMFDTRGDLRPFGVGDEKTPFALGVVVVALSVLSFYVFCIIDVIFGK